MRFSRHQRILCGVVATFVLVIILNGKYDELPMLLSVVGDAPVNYKELEHAASLGRPWWPSLDAGANFKRMRSGWRDDQLRREAEVRGRLDAEVPLPSANQLVSSITQRIFNIQCGYKYSSMISLAADAGISAFRASFHGCQVAGEGRKVWKSAINAENYVNY